MDKVVSPADPTDTNLRVMPLADAIIHAIMDVKRNGGGTVWLHDPDCDDMIQSTNCPCVPYPIPVEGEAPN